MEGERNPLVLGTAQLGMRYGIANRTGQPDRQTAIEIVRTAWEQGIREFDTAQGYGQSEEVLGCALRSLGVAGQARVITKLAPAADYQDVAAMRQSLQESLARLGTDRLFGVMMHRENLLDHWEAGLGDTLREMVDEGLAEHIGVSVYSPARALQALATDAVAMLQIPANLLDRRFEQAGVFESAERSGKPLYLRSVFLQGLLLMQSDALPAAMRHIATILNKIDQLGTAAGCNRHELALTFVSSAYPRARLVIGAETPAQVRQNAQYQHKRLPATLVKRIQEAFPDVAEKVLNPAQWQV